MPVKRNNLAKSYPKPKPAREIKPAADPKPTETNAAIETGKAATPEWVSETHPDHMYRLVLFECGDASVEEIDMTRGEFIALKAHLSAMRGYEIRDVSAAVTELIKDSAGSRSPDIRKSASRLQAARELYRNCRSLVIFDSIELDEHLARLAE